MSRQKKIDVATSVRFAFTVVLSVPAPKDLCAPDNITSAQAVYTVPQYSNTHVETGHIP